jgi:hypothetical protein
MDWLRDELVPLFESNAQALLRDPWRSRNDYICVILDRSQESRERFLREHASHDLSEAEKVTVLKLLELQRHAMLMYTSCGWFFDEISGIESVQVVQYAARAMQLARELFHRDLEPGFLGRFEGAKSNIAEHHDGRWIYEHFVKPAALDWPKAVAHYAISSLFKQYEEKTRIFSFCVADEHRHLLTAGKTRLAVGRTRITSEITHESDVLAYAILYMGEHNLTGGVGKFASNEAYDIMYGEIKAAYESADFPETIRLIDRHFGHAAYSLKSLFKDEQRRILDEILASTREDLENRFRLITERYTPLMKFLRSAGAPLPPALETVTEYVLHSDIRRLVESDPIDFERLEALVREAQTRDSKILDADISYVVKNRMEKLMLTLSADPHDVDLVHALEKLAQLVMPLPLGLNLWKVQNAYWEMAQTVLPLIRRRAANGEEAAQSWLRQFLALGDRLEFAPQSLQAPEFLLKAAA